MASRTPDELASAGDTLDTLRAEALAAVRRYAEEAFDEREFVPGETNVPVAGRVIGAPELEALVDASLDGWLTEGRFARAFSEAFAGVVGRSQALPGRLGIPGQPARGRRHHLAPARAAAPAGRRGDHARARLLHHRRARSTSTGSCRSTWTWSSTPSTRPSRPSPPRSSDRTRAILVAHCLGNPFDAGRRGRALPRARPRADRGLLRRARLHLRRAAGGQLRAGGDVLVLPRPPHDDGRGRRGRGRRPDLAAGDRLAARMGPRLLVPAGRERRLRQALRRAASASCPPASTTSTCSRTWASTSRSPTCRRRSAWRSSSASRASAHAAPAELRATARGALAARGQARPAARARRRPIPPGSATRSRCATGSSDDRRDLQRFLLERKIDNRLLLGGNLTRQPGFLGREHRIPAPLDNADRVMDASVWVGCYPGLTDEMVDWIAESITAFLATRA